MLQHVSETCNEGNGLWLPLTEYSVKSGVSLSTIRRKIKSNSIKFRLDKGRYLILFSDMNNTAARQAPLSPDSGRRQAEEILLRTMPESRDIESSVRMVSDAFEHALREKDERIRLLEKRSHELEERLKELQLLVRVLEEKYEVRY